LSTAGNEIPRPSCNSKLYHRVHKCPPPDPIPSQLEPVHALTTQILLLLSSRPVRILCALSLESRQIYQHGLDTGPLEFQILRHRGCLTNLFRILSLCFRVIGKTPGLISRNNMVKKKIVSIVHRDNDLARCDSISPFLRCQGVWNKTCTQLSPSQILFQNPKNY
jgi:hypothetical protein